MSYTPYLMTASEVAAYLGVSLRTLSRWHKKRSGPPRIILGHKAHYRLEALLKWIESLEQGHTRASEGPHVDA